MSTSSLGSYIFSGCANSNPFKHEPPKEFIWPPEQPGVDRFAWTDFSEVVEAARSLACRESRSSRKQVDSLIGEIYPEGLHKVEFEINNLDSEKTKISNIALLNLLRSRNKSLYNEELAAIVHGLAYSDVNTADYTGIFREIVKSIKAEVRKRGDLSNLDLANIYFGLSGLDLRVVTESLINQLGRHLNSLASKSSPELEATKVTPPELVKIFYGLLNLNSFDENNKIVTEENTWKPLKKILKQDPDLSFTRNRDILYIFQGLQSYETKEFGAELLDAIIARAPDKVMTRYFLSETLNTFYLRKPTDFSPKSYKKIEYLVKDTFKREGDKFSYEDYYKMLYGLQQFSNKGIYKYIVKKLQERLSTGASLDDLTAMNLQQAFSLGEYHYFHNTGKTAEDQEHLIAPIELADPAQSYRDENSNRDENSESCASLPEQRALNAIKKSYGKKNIQSLKPNRFFEGFEVDFVDESKDLVIEIDGRYHIGPKKAKDGLRDDALKYFYKKRTAKESNIPKDLNIYRFDITKKDDGLWMSELLKLTDRYFLSA